MLSGELIHKKVLDACHLIGIREESIDIEFTDDYEKRESGQWQAGAYLSFSYWDRSSHRVDVSANKSLLRHTETFCDACIAAGLLRLLDDEYRHRNYPNEWAPYRDAHALLASDHSEEFLLVYPKGSLVRICECGETQVYSPGETAFGRAEGLARRCPRCHRPAHVAATDTYILTTASGKFIESDSGIAPLTCKTIDKHRSLDLDSLLDAGLIDDIRNIGMATFLQEGGMSFAESWAYLSNHPWYKGRFPQCFDLETVMVCRDTMIKEDEEIRNTCPRVWIEGEYDAAGSTFEEAVCNLAQLVRFDYESYGQGDD